ncbi:hypothetical protein JOF53_005171 [Crossiella equi]|uniref:Uncharacterized protein n=1 Tax=Crossiella equi TaxID=130796 RepID=A0ABS5AI95_9PSEU|nr:hypothetical protein [Crossiella equi]MBP2476299.1 hypothetical protein [Crossiella equi]
MISTAKLVIQDLAGRTPEDTPDLKVYAEMMSDHPDLALYEITFYPERWESVVGREGPRATETDAEFTARAAEELQAMVLEHRGFAVPRCPGHEHAVVTEVAEDVARWVCPEDGDVHFAAVVGEYAAG